MSSFKKEVNECLDTACFLTSQLTTFVRSLLTFHKFYPLLQIVPALIQCFAFSFSSGSVNFSALKRFGVPIYLQISSEAVVYVFLFTCLGIAERMRCLNRKLKRLQISIGKSSWKVLRSEIKQLKEGYYCLNKASDRTQNFFSLILTLILYQRFTFLLILGVLMYTKRTVASFGVYFGIGFMGALALLQFYLLLLGPEKAKRQVRKN
jgi:hypothetical protein